MSSLNFPDINLWLAIAAPEHAHAPIAQAWWDRESGAIAFCRLTQLGFLRLVTTAAVMDGKPLTMNEAWQVYDRFYEDDRVTFIPEPAGVDKRFREKASGRTASPKVWADSWLLAFAQAADGVLVTFDHALASRGASCLLNQEQKPSKR
jgi:toxin-antitoxin system PIN domain toxin